MWPIVDSSATTAFGSFLDVEYGALPWCSFRSYWVPRSLMVLIDHRGQVVGLPQPPLAYSAYGVCNTLMTCGKLA